MTVETTSTTSPITTIVLGGTGYVSGELLRLLAAHPVLRVAGVISDSAPGKAVADIFPHLRSAYPDLALTPRNALAALIGGCAGGSPVAMFSAGPHGASAKSIDETLRLAEAAGTQAHLVDLSADFRHHDLDRYASLYGEHAAPERLAQFTCSVPEHTADVTTPHACHPGCFTTSVTIPLVALLATGLVEPRVHVSAVTGSTGSGRTPKPTTHHPERLSNLFAYGALSHRHEPEMIHLAATATGQRPDVRFVPHSGPFARGIHATLHADLTDAIDADTVRARVAAFYANDPFVTVRETPPRLKDVVGTNHCHLGVATRGTALVVTSVIDNLVKGAAGGAVQWMNKLFDLDEAMGLEHPGLGWL